MDGHKFGTQIAMDNQESDSSGKETSENESEPEEESEEKVAERLKAIQIAKERAENSNKISKALIVFGYDSWLTLEPSK